MHPTHEKQQGTEQWRPHPFQQSGSVAAEDESSVGAEDEQEDIIREASTGPGLEAGQVDPT